MLSDFDLTMKLSLPEDGMYAGHAGTSRAGAILV